MQSTLAHFPRSSLLHEWPQRQPLLLAQGANARRSALQHRLRAVAAVAVLAGGMIAGPSASAAGLLGTAQDYTVLAHETVTNAYGSGSAPTQVYGELGVSPGSAVTGFAPVDASANAGVVTGGSIHLSDVSATQAMADAGTAYNQLQALTPTSTLTGLDLGSFSAALAPGIYVFGSAALLNGTLNLDFASNPTGSFVFQIGSTLTTASDSIVNVLNASEFSSIYWQIGSSATLGQGTQFAGNLLARTSVTLNAGAEILGGRAFALDGAVTLIDNQLSNDCNAGSLGSTNCADAGSLGYSGELTSAVPEPGSVLMMLSGLALLGRLARRRGGAFLPGLAPRALRADAQT